MRREATNDTGGTYREGRELMDQLEKLVTADAWATWRSRRRSVCEEDLAHILEQREVINTKFGSDGPLAQFTDDITLLFSLLHDYWAGTYFEVPWATVAGAIAALEVAVGSRHSEPGLLEPSSAAARSDEATRVALCLAAVEWEVHEYRRWLVRASSAAPRGD